MDLGKPIDERRPDGQVHAKKRRRPSVPPGITAVRRRSPGHLRRALDGGTANYWTELGVDVDPTLWTDQGDLDPPDDTESTLDVIAGAAADATSNRGRRLLPADLAGPVYVTIDVDALDPAFAPGISHHEPGGMTTRQLIRCLHQAGGDAGRPSQDL